MPESSIPGSAPIPMAPPPPTTTSFHLLPLFSPSSPLFLFATRLPHLSLKTPSPQPPHATSTSTSCSFNGWAELAAATPQPPAPFLPLLLLPDARHRPLRLLLPLLAGSLALALSRVRVPPLALLPASALLFAAGFAAAEAKRSADLGALLSDLEIKVGALRDQLVRSEGGDAGDLAEAVDCVRVRVGDARKLVEGRHKSAPRMPVVVGDAVSDLGKYLAALIQENLAELSSPPKKSTAGSKEKLAASAAAGEKISNVHANNAKEMPVAGVGDGTNEKKKFLSSRDGVLSFDDETDDSGAGLGGRSEQGGLERLVFKHKYGQRSLRNVAVDSFEGGSDGGSAARRRKSTGFVSESKESSLLERTLEIRDRSYRLKIGHMFDNELSGVKLRPEDEFGDNAPSFDSVEDGSISSSMATSDGEDFHHEIKEATEALRKARECMMDKNDEEMADALLYKSARLFSAAAALRPTSLLAVGQLGNTYLLHGELKLKISRELRTLLSHSEAYLSGKERGLRLRKLDKRILSRDNVSSALVDVCEECESLLIEAGRSYRMALSIDSVDVKALYNWGLALTFRAQLIADIGPEAAVDADKVYLAAIDKFDTLLSKSNAYAPEALYRWGTALQQRSHLRPQNNRDKIRLLEQAKSMFEDVLYVEADNKLVREALSSCISELNYHGRWL